MTYEDYNQGEIDNAIKTLLEERGSKLKVRESWWLRQMYGKKVSPQDRDTIIAMYDRMAEANYE